MLSPGRSFGAFQIVNALGSANTSEVYHAYDEQLRRDVAIKLLAETHAADAAGRAQLLHEARAAAALNHPHICTIYEVGEADAHVYVAMELVEGRPLDRIIPDGGLAERDVFDYGLQIADAVAHAHENAIVHRNLKTSNIMVTSTGGVKVLDFGSRPLGDARVTGTLAYLSPEQVRGGPATAASDVWALGVLLHEMATGERPFDGPSGSDIAAAILEHRPRPVPNTVPAILRGMIARCLAKDPKHRYRNAGELRAALDTVRIGHLPSHPRPIVASSGHVEAAGAGQDAIGAMPSPSAVLDTALHDESRAHRGKRLAGLVAAAIVTMVAMTVLASRCGN